MEGNASSQQLGTPLMQPTSSVEDDEVDRYDALGSTTALKIHSHSLTSSIVDGSTRTISVASSEDEADVAAGAKLSSPLDSTLTAFVLAVILFFNAGGGPFGVEPSLKAAGNFYAIIGFAAMPFLWALPEAVMTYELSSLYPCASGGVRWVRTTFVIAIKFHLFHMNFQSSLSHVV
mmetsp:Transcript_23300/g.41763  ORF Transcript_23300/g.41763 Transcript_23300/m.41763 type:complete len:176 (+) Transcript_23300:47-574(+)